MSAAPLHPQMAAVVEMVRQSKAPPLDSGTPQAARAHHNATAYLLDVAAPPVLKVDDVLVKGAGATVPVRVYTPRAPNRALPVVVWIHGGGHVIGNIDTYDSTARRLALGTDALVVSVEYRLAPEHPFPAAVNDCMIALRWVFDEVAALGGDPARVAVAGDSAGGNLAAVCALHARDSGHPLRAQALVYPAVAPRPQYPSSSTYAEGYLLTRALIDWFQAHYQSGHVAREVQADWRFAPLLSTSHAGLPPALVLLAECDPLHDEGVAYAEVLSAAGVSSTVSVYRGMTHAFFSFAGVVDAANEAMEEVCSFLSQRLRGT